MNLTRNKAISILKIMKTRTEKKADGPFKKDNFFSDEAAALGMAIASMEKDQYKQKLIDLGHCCETCRYGVDYGDSVDHIYCEKFKSRKKSVKKKDVCEDWKECEVEV